MVERAKGQARDRDRDRLLEENLGLVEGVARRFEGRGEPRDDLIQVASIGLIKAAERFEPERGVPFRAYAMTTMVGEVKRHFRDKSWAIKVPRRIQEHRRLIVSAVDELSQKLGRSPKISEIASHTGLALDAVAESLAAGGAYQPDSLPDEEHELAPGGRGLMTEATDESVDAMMSVEPGLARLSSLERQIVVLRFFQDLSQRQIAAAVGISQMHVSRLLSKAMRVLREWADESASQSRRGDRYDSP